MVHMPSRKVIGHTAKSFAFASAAVLGALFTHPASAYEAGWYYGFDAYYTMTSDSDGNTFVPGTAGTPATDPSRNCLLGDLLGLGSLIGSLGGTGPDGCLLGLLGPDIPGSEAIDPTADQNFRTLVRFKDGFTGEMTVGYLFEGGLRPEFSLAYTESDWDTVTLELAGASQTNSSSNSLRALRFMGNLWYDLDFGGPVIPYVGAGLGYQNTQVSGDLDENDGGLTYQLGAGVGVNINEHMMLSLDYRFVTADDPTFETSDGGNVSTEYQSHNVGLGLRYFFGGAGLDSDGDGVRDRNDKCPNTPQGAAVDSRGCPLDTDSDGVPDYKDECPNTPKGVAVGANGCPLDSDGDGVPDSLDQCAGTPAGTQVGPDGCPLTDTDGDGVPDYKDKCPNTPQGVAVGADGCPLDSDGDGVPDHMDECPKSPPGAKVLPNGCALTGDCRRPRPGEQVDENGCAVDQSFILRGVNFEFDSDRLTPEARVILNQVGATLNAYKGVKVDVEGHTDNIGSDAYNLGLSERRANAVKTYLAGQGVDGDRMQPVGYGESRPIVSNDDEAGRAENRRVVLKVIE
ncbi:hypothetical protein E4T66_12200 [Sinimarinibacterium sp. CAU 1509]|nr:hypothetical protein E4T66_12200 [Sinimarinibacterium sp. CAU 1509]